MDLDPTDFPLVRIPKLGLVVQLLPVTKVQFEYFLGEAPSVRQFDPSVYAEMTAANPRGSWRNAIGRPESVFLTGVLPTEAEAFAHWLGEGFRLPRDDEWREIDRAMASPANTQLLDNVVANRHVHPGARALLASLGSTDHPPSWRQIGLFENGFLEWVRTQDGYRLLGRCRLHLYQLILNPQVHEAIRLQANPIPRHKAFGFRLVRPTGKGEGA